MTRRKDTPRSGGPDGQLPFVPTPEDRELVALLVDDGITHENICRFVKNPGTGEHIGLNTLRRHFVDELADGKMIMNAKVKQTLFAMATSGKVVAATIFWAKTRMGYKEPAQDVNLAHSYGELVEAASAIKPEKVALSVVQGGKP